MRWRMFRALEPRGPQHRGTTLYGMRTRDCLVITLALACTDVAAQTTTASSPAPTSWSFGVSAAMYLVPDDQDYLQPTFTADRGRLHLEARYN